MKFKTVLMMVALVAFSSNSVFARSIDPRHVVAKIDAQMMGLESATLLDSGELIVIADGSEQLFTKKLSPSLASRLEGLAIQLADAEVKTVKKDVVCMTFVAVSGSELSVSGYDSNTGRFDGSTRLILSQRGCSVHVETFPRKRSQLSVADQLKSLLEVLAQDLVESNR